MSCYIGSSHCLYSLPFHKMKHFKKKKVTGCVLWSTFWNCLSVDLPLLWQSHWCQVNVNQDKWSFFSGCLHYLGRSKGTLRRCVCCRLIGFGGLAKVPAVIEYSALPVKCCFKLKTLLSCERIPPRSRVTSESENREPEKRRGKAKSGKTILKQEQS